MVAGTDRAPRTRLLRGFNGGRREDGWTTEMRCRMRNEEELFGGGGQSLTILLRNHHIKAHDVLTGRESPVQSGAATAMQHDHHTTTTHGSPNPKNSVAKHQEAHQDVLDRVRLQTALVQTRDPSKHAWCCGPAQSSELPLASRREAGARTDPCSRCFRACIHLYRHAPELTERGTIADPLMRLTLDKLRIQW